MDHEFKGGRISLKDDPRKERSKSASTEEYNEIQPILRLDLRYSR